MSGLLAAALCSVALSAQMGHQPDAQVAGFQASGDIAGPAVFAGDSIPDLIVSPASGAGATRVFSGAGFGFLGAGFPFNPNFAGGVRVASGDINGDGVADVVAGQGPGGSLVTLINGATITGMGAGHPFGAGFTGGVYVASADINGDGLSDIIVGQGTGGGRLMAFSGADISLLMNAAPFGTGFTGGVTVAAGDVNGDGFADIFAGQASGGGGVALFDGATRGLLVAAPVFGPSGVSVALGDVNGDGRADAIMAPHLANGPVIVYDIQTITQLAAFVPYGSANRGVRLASADFDGDGKAEIVTGPGPGGGSTIRVISGGTFAQLASFDAYAAGFNAGVYVAAPSLRRPAQFTSPAAAAFTVGQAGTFSVTTSGTPRVTLISQTGALPPGVTFVSNGDGTATLSGTPTGPGGSFPLTFNASNGVGAPAAQSFVLSINQAPAITSAATATFAEGTPHSFTVTTTGFPAPQIQHTGSLPGGLTLVDNGNGTATLSGTAADGSANTYNLTVSASNGVGTAASQPFVLTVEPDCPATITFTPLPGALAGGTAGMAYGPVNFTASPNLNYTFAVTAGALPAGLTLSSAGSLAGTPTTTGAFGFTITATSPAGCTGTAAYTLNIAANAQNDTFDGVGNTQLVVGAAPPSTPHVFYANSVLANDAGAGQLTVTPAVMNLPGGQVALSANGTFIYTPAVGFAGPFTFDYTMTDVNGATDTATVTINLLGRVWYVNAVTPGVPETGQSDKPFNTMTEAAAAANAAGEAIYVHAGSPAGATELNAGQFLAGAGGAFTYGPLTIPPTASPVLTSTVTLANNSNVGGVTINAGAADAILANGLTGVETVNVQITGGAAGLNLVNMGGTLNVITSSITGVTGPDVLVNGGTGTMNINAAITNTQGRAVEIAGRIAGTVTFTGPIVDTGGAGIFLNNNPGSTIAFTGGLNLSTGANPAFTATNSGTVTATQDNTTIVNTLVTTSAEALRVIDTQIGAAGLTFRSITAGTGIPSPGNGISLVSTGIAAGNGGLTVTGDGVNPQSGGRIQRKTGADGSISEGNGIYLANTRNVSLSWMQLDNFDNAAIAGENVHGFTLAFSVIDGVVGNNGALNEGAIVLGRPDPSPANGLIGAGLIHHSWIRNGVRHNIAVYNQSGAMSLQLVGTNPNNIDCQVTDSLSLDGLYIQLEGSASGLVSGSRCRFRNNNLAGMRLIARDQADLRLSVNDSTFSGPVRGVNGIIASNEDDAQLRTSMLFNAFQQLDGVNIQVDQNSTATALSQLHATINNNTVSERPASATAYAVAVSLNGTASPARIAINNFTQISDAVNWPASAPGIGVFGLGTSPAVDVTLLDNHIDMQDDSVLFGMFLQAVGGTNMCANVARNRSHYEPDNAPTGGGGILAQQAGGAIFRLERVDEPQSSPPAVVLAQANLLSTTLVDGALTVVDSGDCQVPLPPTP
jgi:hypothetical protein